MRLLASLLGLALIAVLLVLARAGGSVAYRAVCPAHCDADEPEGLRRLLCPNVGADMRQWMCMSPTERADYQERLTEFHTLVQECVEWLGMPGDAWDDCMAQEADRLPHRTKPLRPE